MSSRIKLGIVANSRLSGLQALAASAKWTGVPPHRKLWIPANHHVPPELARAAWSRYIGCDERVNSRNYLAG
jgi:hypothetical protein